MAIFHSYVKLPEVDHGEFIQMILLIFAGRKSNDLITSPHSLSGVMARPSPALTPAGSFSMTFGRTLGSDIEFFWGD